ncbi:carboxylate-amine ligase [Catellatospora citrea]|uniref:Putative glutamate--cysteine ligase 2 n=1 Tax=Catellatospora citrea TaxID=53366 RepID=A0A8J3P213_9ACTN|nr:glutamate--cysteine ligase [Catellatospora citrea]RKE12123.1 carboxylate-amine ligase [Catellatospora citrea]GIF98915.1 putative glutamate--cysteine ligase 2 [Catellatospora citrea]
MDPGFKGDGCQVAVADRSPLTLGVEEEFLLLDTCGSNLPVADEVLARLSGQALEQSRHEFRESMIEMVTPVCGDLAQLREHLASSRAEAAAAGAALGARLVAVGATPLREAAITRPAAERYERIIGHFGPVALDPALCGCHVHVGVPDRELAVQVCNHLRPWLPVVQAIAANSPFHAGVDTGYASWRSIQMERWPSLGPSPYFASAAEYDRTVQQLITAGVMLDVGMVLWYARPSARYPTVEVRVADVLPTVDDAVVVAGLVRALVVTVVDDIRAGLPAPRLRTGLLTAAHWRAARDGLEGHLVNATTGELVPAWELVDDLLRFVGPALTRDGDLRTVIAGLDRLRIEGSGAERQRRVHRRTGDVRDVLAYLAAETTGDGAR